MATTPTGSESVPKVGSPEKGMAGVGCPGPDEHGLTPLPALLPGMSCWFIPPAGKEDEGASDGAAKRPKPEEEEVGDDAAKRPKPDDYSAFKRPMPEEDESLAWLELSKGPMVLDSGKTSAVPKRASAEELRAELKLMLQYQKLLSGGQVKKVKERVEPEAIQEALQKGLLQAHPAGRTAVRQELPECLEHMPESFRAAFLKNKAVVKRVVDYQEDIVDQYNAKGFAEVDAHAVE
ncbi:hypothetical protein EJB05_26018 [Eragrostis curvula]|uniref:Uncharacterized protein n=1 Tax=Eragrostis curvula TaxID=38414 RepID=A0A5J9UIU2_9POAL|nr:hypothetical protein EJB05_26018 [Eragrostis curvula]